MEDIENNQEETEVEAVETTEEIPVDTSRPIFNSLIDNKESSRYILDMMK
jgi:hypothetical protein